MVSLNLPPNAASGATYTTLQQALARDSCHETANMLDDFIG
jgi:hypothetical protein